METPLLAILIGGLTTAILASGWLRTGKQWLLYLMVAAILLTVGAVILERAVMTDREQITATLHEIADLVERNEIDAAFEYAHSSSPEVRSEAAGELTQYEFHEVSIRRNLEIQVFPERIPPTAIAEFNVLVVFSTKDRFVTDSRVLRFVEVTFLKEETGEWRVSDYAHYPPTDAFRVEDARSRSR
jgi:hypothetical protein